MIRDCGKLRNLWKVCKEKYVMHTKIPNVIQGQTPTNRLRYRMLKQIPKKKRTQFTTNKHVVRVLQEETTLFLGYNNKSGCIT